MYNKTETVTFNVRELDELSGVLTSADIDIKSFKDCCKNNKNICVNIGGSTFYSCWISEAMIMPAELDNVLPSGNVEYHVDFIGFGMELTFDTDGNKILYSASENGGGGSTTGMERFPIKLVKNGNTFKITDWDGNNLLFNTLKNTLKDVTKYVVMVYGNSKLRPQYVSDSEIIFIGLTEDSTGAKILRVVYTPSRCSYTATGLVDSGMIFDIESGVLERFYNINYVNEYKSLQTADNFIIPLSLANFNEVYLEIYNPISSVDGAYLYINDIFEDVDRVFVGSFTDRTKPSRRIIHLKRVNTNYYLLETWGATVADSQTSLECTNITSVPFLVKLADGAPTLTASSSGCFTQNFKVIVYASASDGGGV